MKSLVNVIALGASLVIVGCYGLVNAGKARRSLFDWANALGAAPLVISEIMVGAWSVLVLTACFGGIGVLGIVEDRREKACAR